MARNNVWMSVSDLMTGLMVIFLFVAIAYIKRVQDNQSVLTQYVENRQDLHDKLVAEFKGSRPYAVIPKIRAEFPIMSSSI